MRNVNIEIRLPKRIFLLLLLVFLRGKLILVIITLIGILFYSAASITLPILDPPIPKLLQDDDFNEDVVSEASVVKRNLFSNYPKISQDVENIIDLVVRDFIDTWFSHINGNPSSEFPQTVRAVLLGCVEKLQSLLQRKDEASLIVLKLLPLISKYFDEFCLAREAVMADMTFARDEDTNAELSVAVEFNKNFRLHRALSLRSNYLNRDISQYVKLRMENFLSFIIGTKELSSPYVCILLREILSSCIAEPIIVKFSDPDAWNLKLISISEKILEEYDQVDEIRKILSKEVEEQRNPIGDTVKNERQPMALELVPNLSNKQFEDFLRQISCFTSFIDLQSTKYSLLTKLLQLKKINGLSKNLLEYNKRLYLSLNLVQTRLLYVNDKGYLKKMRLRDPNTRGAFDAEKELEQFEAFLGTISLEDILQENYCLSFFEKFIRENSLKEGSAYLEYWKLVEGLKNPLENTVTESISVSICDTESSNFKTQVLKFFEGDHLATMSSLNRRLVEDILQFKGVNIDDSMLSSNRRSMLLLQDLSQEALNRFFFQRYKESSFFLEMISSPGFASTDVYARLIDLPAADKADAKLQTKKSVDAVRILTHPDISDALDRILNDKNGRRTSTSKPKNSWETLFGNDDDGDGDRIFNDTLFNNDDRFEAVESFFGNQDEEETQDSTESLSNSINSGLNAHSEISSDKLQNSTHTFTSLKDDIAKLTLAIDDIEKELELLDHLILKADLTNNQNQLKLLRKSQKALLKDLDNKELLKQQCLVQENANSLYGKTKICIRSYYVDTQLEHGHEVAYYLINVEHSHQGQVTAWEIPRRFNEFFKLNSTLKKKYKSQVKHLQKRDIFPEKVKMSLKYHVSKVLLYEERKERLERYLRELLAIPEICQDNLFRVFLTDSASFNAKEEVVSKPLLRSLEGSGTDLSHKRESSTDFQTRQIDADYEEELNFYEDDRNFYHNKETGRNSQNKSFVKPICDLFISVFSLNRSNSGWLRGKTIITVLQQLLGSTIEKYVKNSIRKLRDEDQILRTILLLKESLWGPEGVFSRSGMAAPNDERTKGEKARTQADSQAILQSLFAETCGKVIGLRTAREAGFNIHSMVQNQFLMASLLLEIMDTVLDEICDDDMGYHSVEQ
ncbi:hypothetical protein ZYGR_0AD03340 [Zygosaccharomyces rouxii]|uniref:Uncharacterized protein n=1 Tax=Zygosaccharomyces rouxii TaxID=4956 RepID=A0A1Q3A678_ZYGRO|nr:hypothetical protein ZYGR_0AD03340 [Zygosaccharomyces rouxii]